MFDKHGAEIVMGPYGELGVTSPEIEAHLEDCPTCWEGEDEPCEVGAALLKSAYEKVLTDSAE